MRHTVAVLFLVLSTVLAAQAPEPPVSDARLSVHTLVREDLFAGFLQSDLPRLARGEKNVSLLMASRPADRASLLAWQGLASLTRAAMAHEAGQTAQFQQHYNRARESFTEAIRLGPDSVPVFAIVGGSQSSIADRLPAAERTAGWEQAYVAYQQLWKLQGAGIDTLPLHHKGEVLSGLTQAAQRTGRTDEAAAQLDRMLSLLPNTPYAARAQQWKDNPSSREQTTITCQTCHAAGTLAARLAEVSR